MLQYCGICGYHIVVALAVLVVFLGRGVTVSEILIVFMGIFVVLALVIFFF